MEKHVLTPRQMRMIERNLDEYKEAGKSLRWLSTEEKGNAERTRLELIAGFKEKINFLFNQTKPVWRNISPGCRICGEGGWSCLFINGKCNCRCFYCPTPQDDISIPTTNRLPFPNEQTYSDYVTHFGYSGVSISGGEPLLTPEKTLRYIQCIRKNHGDDLHIWMYTNGSLVTAEIIQQLKDAGLNEIRFDISARDYALDKLALAVNQIPVVTVEIPAIPEDLNRLAALIPTMHSTGVNYLNLHQIRLTPHNSRFLISRNYTFLHGDKVTVLDSELTALSLLKQSVENSWNLPINYCAFAYKNQFQRAAMRKRSACFIIKGHESITETGLIRTLTIKGKEHLTQTANILSQVDPEKKLWQINSDKFQIRFHESLWPHIDISSGNLTLSYAEAILSPTLSYYNPFKEIRLPSGMKLYVEKASRATYDLKPQDAEIFEQRVIRKDQAFIKIETPDLLNDEFIQPGLQKYF